MDHVCARAPVCACVHACVWCVCVCVFNVPLTSKVICRQVHSLDMFLNSKFFGSNIQQRMKSVQVSFHRLVKLGIYSRIHGLQDHVAHMLLLQNLKGDPK